jgi:hypothetical protein
MDALFQKAAEWAGLGAPFSVAASVYLFFHLADSRASREAKEAISNWMKPLPYDAKAVSLAILEIFDRLYSSPLLTWRAFKRSALFSIFAIVVLWIMVIIIHPEFWDALDKADTLRFLISYYPLVFFLFVVADYLSLFIVRKWIVLSSGRPWLAISSGIALGLLIIVITICAFTALTAIRAWIYYSRCVSLSVIIWELVSSQLAHRFEALLVPTLFVHLWLPLMAFTVLCMRGLNWFLRAAGWLQWFLEGGKEHPLQAVGYVSAFIVFVALAGGRWVGQWVL